VIRRILKNPATPRILGALALLLAAVFSIGYHHPDEHFQILEFAGWKLGLSPAKDLAWEAAAGIRPALQPLIVWILGKALTAVGAYNPFTVALILRLGMAVLWFFVLTRLVETARKKVPDLDYRFLTACTFLLWWVPYISVRFSGESLSGALLCLAVCALWNPQHRWSYLGAGLALGLGCWMRPQLGFAVLGILVWMAVRRKEARLWAALAVGGHAGAGIGLFTDCWFYGRFILTPLAYYEVNIVQGVAADFGVEPFWWYLWGAVLYATPLLAALLVGMYVRGARRAAVLLPVLVSAAFILGHSAVAHKEFRFLFPVSWAAVLVAVVGAQGWRNARWSRAVVYVAAVMNILLLLFRTLMPAQEAVAYYRALYKLLPRYDRTVVAVAADPYIANYVRVNFYRPPGTTVITVPTEAALDSLLRSQPARRWLVVDYRAQPGDTLKRHRLQTLYSFIPPVAHRVNFNNWLARSRVWTIYAVQARRTP